MLKNLLRPAMIVIPLTAGALCPDAAPWNFLIRYLIMLMVFMVFLKLDIKELMPRRSHILIFAANIFVGTSSFLLTYAFTASRELAQAAFFSGITPTATAAAVVMSFLGGTPGYVVTSFVITNAGIAMLLPVMLPWVCGTLSFAFIWKVTESLLMLIALPALTAYILRKLRAPVQKLPAKLQSFTFSLWSAALFLIAATAADFFRQNPHISKCLIVETALVSLLICAVNFALGYWLGEKDFRREASQSLGQKNTTLTIYLALAYAGPVAALGVTFYVLWHNSYNAVQIFIHDRKKNESSRTDE